MLITYKLLKEHGACEEQANRFRELYPKGLEPTVENLINLTGESYYHKSLVPKFTSYYFLDVTWLINLIPMNTPEDKEFQKLDQEIEQDKNDWREKRITILATILLDMSDENTN
jgi:hypothetical protein